MSKQILNNKKVKKLYTETMDLIASWPDLNMVSWALISTKVNEFYLWLDEYMED